MPIAIDDRIITDFRNLLKNPILLPKSISKIGKTTKKSYQENYTMLFRILGKSKYPLSSYQIKKEMEKVDAGIRKSICIHYDR